MDTLAYLNALKHTLSYWHEWVVHEEDLLNRCTDEETKVLLKNRLVGGYRVLNLTEIELIAVENAYNAAKEDMAE